VILSSDRWYRRAKEARQGRRRLDPRFDGFVRGFADRFGFPPLWLETDHVERRDGGLPRPRLDVVLERRDQARPFRTAAGGYRVARQRAVVRLFAEALDGVDLRGVFGLPDGVPPAYPRAEDLFVCFSEFERIALDEVHSAVTEAELDRFTAGLGLGERFWCAQRAYGPPVVFVYTAEQAAELESSPQRANWADAWFSLASGHDEFGYLRRDDVSVHVDSKENFDKNYQSNWYWYF
jgi:hypothetical protein